jgi:protein-S-isoprenylcysteine O-methyltransferase Ste14
MPGSHVRLPSFALRTAGIATGVAVHALFAVTVYYLFVFLQGTPPRPGHASLALDAVLALQFGVIHTVLLLPGTRKRLERVIPSAFYGLFFCTVTCATLLVAMAYWQVGSWAVWELSGWANVAMQALWYGSWAALFYSLSLMGGFGYQTGWVPWWAWLHGRPAPRRKFEPHGAFLLLRHPVYLSLLGLVWCTPHMTVDRALLVTIWTLYVFVGSYCKERRLIHYLGDTYRQYQAEVPGYPGMLMGPLARRRFTTAEVATLPAGVIRVAAAQSQHANEQSQPVQG